jgi:uncharacterized Zn finger protein
MASPSVRRLVSRYIRQAADLNPGQWRKQIGNQLDSVYVLMYRITEHATAVQQLLDRAVKKLLARAPSVKLANIHVKSDNKTLTATAKGTNDYTVEIVMQQNPPYHCTCPFYAKAGIPCKHVLALASNWRGETETALDQLDGWLETALTRTEYEG